MPRRSALVGPLWRWHRRVGVLAAVFVLLLAITGIVLNHAAELHLDRRFVDAPWLLRAYGDHSSSLPAVELDAHWLSQAGNGHVYFDAREVAPCGGKLVGAVAAGELLLAACSQELLLLTRAGELVETVTASTGLPTPLQAVGLSEDRVVVQVADTWWLADLESLEFAARAPAGTTVMQPLVTGQLPDAIRQQIPAPEQWLSWERVLLDLHSGRLFGRLGVWWMDAVGVLLATLAASGVVMWWLHRRRRH